ncbi:MAG: type I methionyl aminopeptidase [Prevotellaceae bacterium]|nr:type I methionyl aminopeptidase [Candidatus Faecinaster equi]
MKRKNWKIPKGQKPTDLDLQVLDYQERGFLCPSRDLIKTQEQIEGIRQSGIINTGVLDLVAKEIHAGMSTAEIDELVYDYTISHGAIPAPLNYEGFPKSVCTSINEVVCHGIPNEEEILYEGDIINVDVSTIYKGYFSDASRMFIIGNTSIENKKLISVAKECLDLGAKAAEPFCTVGDIADVITKHAHKNGFKVVRDFTGHGVGLEFHEEPEVFHYGKRHTGMLLVPGMVFTIEPMINMGCWQVFIDEEDDWTVVTEDELPSAQWEHTFLMTENGVEILTH